MSNQIIRDSVYGDISCPKYIKALIDTNEFQRLRYIKQLGGVSMVYIGATHTRFQHSIGVYKNLLDIKNYNTTHNFSKQEWKTLFCAGLLHDIGHGPLSHNLEIISNYQINHEKIGMLIILDLKSEINKILKKNGIKPEDIIKIYQGKSARKIFSELISSQIDADRMDYLLRDAHNTGTSCGLYDKGRLIKSMILSGEEMTFKKSGIPVIEGFLFARYQAFLQIYHHRTGIVFGEMHRLLFKRLLVLKNKKEYQPYFIKLEVILTNKFNLCKYLQLNDEVLNTIIIELTTTSDIIMKKLASAIITRNLFVAWDYSKKAENDFRKKIIAKNYDPKYYLTISIIKQQPYLKNTKNPIIIVDKKTGAKVLLHKISKITNALSKIAYKNKFIIVERSFINGY